MCSPEGFHYFLNHLKERLVIILDYNIDNEIDICENDRSLLRELYNLYDKDSIDTFSDIEVRLTVEQRSLFDILVEQSQFNDI